MAVNLKRWICILSLLATSRSFAFEDMFKLPSFVGVQAGGSNQGSRNGAVQAGITFGDNWQFGLNFDGGSSPSIAEDEVLRTKGYGISFGSDPLNLFSFIVTAEGWSMENYVNASGGRLAGVLALDNWTVMLEGGSQKITFQNLPALIWPSRSSTVTDKSFAASVETYLLSPVTIRISGVVHTYDKNLTDYSEGLRILFISPEVLSTATGLNKSEGNVTVRYNLKAWNFGVMLGASRSALDGVRTRNIGLLGSYRLNSKWSFNASATSYKPENAEDSSAATVSSALGFIYSWY